MAKIHIIDGPGSGKSTLAEALAARLNVPHYDLDIIGQRNGTDARAHIDGAFDIAQTPAWITEGIYLVVVDPLLYEADQIILLDVHWRTATWRIVRRHVVKTLRGTNQYPGIPGLRNFLRYAQRYYRNEHSDHADLMLRCLRVHGEMRLPPTRDRMIEFLETYHPVSIPPTAAFVRTYLAKYNDKVVVVRSRDDRKQVFSRFEALVR